MRSLKIVIVEYKIDASGAKEPIIPFQAYTLSEARRITEELTREQIKDCQIFFGSKWEEKQADVFGVFITDCSVELRKFGFVENKSFAEALNILEKK